MKAHVKWFNDAKGFGFLKLEDGKEAFVHWTAIQADGFKSLIDGEEVEFELEEGPKGFCAKNVVRLGGNGGSKRSPHGGPRNRPAEPRRSQGR